MFKKSHLIFFVVVALFLFLSQKSFSACNTLICREQGGASMIWYSGSTLTLNSGATITLPADSIGADDIAAGLLGADVIVSSVAVDAIESENIKDGEVSNDDLAGSIDATKITNTAAVLTANTFSGVQTYDSGSSITAAANIKGVIVSTSIIIGASATNSYPTPIIKVSSATTSGVSLCLAGAFQTLPTSGYDKGCFAYQNSDNIAYISTETVTAASSWKALW